jgi:putative PIN family toxin of toxin-antitoxin system
VIRAVADTNVLISAIVFRGLPETFLELGLLGAFQLVTSKVLLDELAGKLHEKFEMSSQGVLSMRESLTAASLVVSPQIRLAVVKDDPDDDRVLECAVAGEAEFIVTGDRHLLEIGIFNGIEIVKVREFLEIFPARI